MVKWIAFLKRRPGLTVEDFQREWRTTHAEVGRRVPHVRGYVQRHVLPYGYRKGEPAIDGVAELWFDDADSFRAALATPEFAAARDDADRLRERAAAYGILTEEHLIKPGPLPAGGVKNVELVRRRRDLPPERFHRYWREHHGPLASRIPPIRRYVQSHAIEDPATRPLDGIASTWFDDTNAMRESATTEAYRRTREDEDAFVEVPLSFVITREHVVIDPPALS
jgi:uncharacterized protein (TIGR02118 family)